MLEEFDNAKRTYLIDGHAPVQGQIFTNPDLARTYEQLAKGGRDAYYKGAIAQTIDAYFKRIGGDLRYADFAAHTGNWVDPVGVNYRGYDVYELPPNTQGVAALQMLKMLEGFDLKKMGRGSADALHVMVEAKRLAFEDLAKFYADPATYDAPIDRADFGFIRRAASRADRHGARQSERCARRRQAEAGRHDVSHDRRQGRHDGVVDSVELPRHGFGTGRRRPRLHVSGPRRTVRAGSASSQRLCARQAAVSNHHSGFRHERRQAVHELRRDGR